MAPKTSGFAIASLVLGLLCISGVGSVLAIIFGAVAQKKVKESDGTVTGSTMASWGTCLGIVGLIIVAAIVIYAATSDNGATYRYR